jgi:branched-subunit amino acid transport protein
MGTTTVWLAIGLCALITFAERAIGPVATGARELPAAASRIVVLLASALLAALVVTQAFADGDQVRIGADTAGVAVAGILLWRRVHLLIVVLAAALVTGLLRLAGVD